MGKARRATLAGKAVARGHLAQRVAQREGPHLQPRVALSDGAEALQEQWLAHFPEHTLVLDIIHTTEYRWDTAHALLGEPPPQRMAWVRAYLEPLLAGQPDAVITALEAEGHEPTCTVPHRQAVRLNGPGDASCQFHRQPQHQRLYGTAALTPALTEAQAWELAA